jgi:uncharacterized protein involved in exopolysaccharide biosynthesis/Mrp family chromosome partitioning ATPase
LAVAYGALAPPSYTASSELIIDPRDRQVVLNDINPSGLAPDGGVTQIESQARVIESSSVLLRAIAATDLIHDPEFNNEGFAARLTRLWKRAFTALVHPEFHNEAIVARLIRALKGASSAVVQSDAVSEAKTLQTLKRHLAVKRAEKVFVINVDITAHTADKAARLANAIADAYLIDQAEAKAQAGQRASSALKARLDEQRGRVETLEKEIEDYKTTHDIVMASGQLVDDQKLVDINNQLLNAQGRTAALRAKIDQINQLRQSGSQADSIAEAIQSVAIVGLRKEEATLVQRQAEMETRFGPQFPAVATVRTELASVQRLIATELNRISAATQADYERALIDERLLSNEAEKAKAATLGVRQSSVRLRELERDLEAERTVYAAFLGRAVETREEASIDTTNARIITRALPPLEKSWPPFGFLLVGAIGTGFCLGSSLALFREYVTPTILSRGQIERSLGAPVIGILPGSASRVRNGEANPHILAMVAIALRRICNGDVIPGEKVGGRSLLFTSGAHDAEARRQVCRLFAMAATMRGDRVLLVDADVANNKAGATAGLLDVLHGECTLSALVDVAPSTGVAVLGRGRGRPGMPKERDWSVITRMLTEARQHFDLVIVDGGEMAENVWIAPLLTAVGEVLLVGKLASTTQNDVSRTADAATIMGRSISAILLFDPMMKR